MFYVVIIVRNSKERVEASEYYTAYLAYNDLASKKGTLRRIRIDVADIDLPGPSVIVICTAKTGR